MPEGLAEFFIKACSPDGGVVIDPFAGSGTTTVVARAWAAAPVAWRSTAASWRRHASACGATNPTTFLSLSTAPPERLSWRQSSRPSANRRDVNLG